MAGAREHCQGGKILPRLRQDPAYLVHNNMRVWYVGSNGTWEINPRTVDWPKVHAKNLPYMFRQEPGPKNPLGDIKFVFPTVLTSTCTIPPPAPCLPRPTALSAMGVFALKSPSTLQNTFCGTIRNGRGNVFRPPLRKAPARPCCCQSCSTPITHPLCGLMQRARLHFPPISMATIVRQGKAHSELFPPCSRLAWRFFCRGAPLSSGQYEKILRMYHRPYLMRRI